MIHLFSASYNKKDYVIDMLESVKAQTFKNFTFKLLENSTDIATYAEVFSWFYRAELVLDEDMVDYATATPALGGIESELVRIEYDEEYRSKYAPPHPWLNSQLKMLDDGYYMFVADDDILHPTALEEAYKFVIENDYKVAYFQAEVQHLDSEGNVTKTTRQFSGKNIGKGTGITPDCLIDMGSVIIHHSAFKTISGPYFDPYKYDYHKGNYDGEFFEKIAQHYTFYNLDKVLVTKRQTPVSHWHPTA